MSRYSMCPECGHRLSRKYDRDGNWDGDYYCDYCATMYDDDECDEGISVYDAALIWASNGKDEDYMFGYSEEELEEALNS